MWEFSNQLVLALLPYIIIFFTVIGLFWLFAGGIDKIKHPEEYRNKGTTGERAVYLTLTKKFHIPEKQIFRNIYIPTKNGTTEIDLIVVSKKGILVFECKNYYGNVYGDGNQQYWVQYFGKKKSRFLSPVIQNRRHVQHLANFLEKYPNLPIIPFVCTTGNANWKLKNIDPTDHVLVWTGVHFKDIYDELPDFPEMSKYFNPLCTIFRQLERPDAAIREQHVANLQKSQQNPKSSHHHRHKH